MTKKDELAMQQASHTADQMFKDSKRMKGTHLLNARPPLSMAPTDTRLADRGASSALRSYTNDDAVDASEDVEDEVEEEALVEVQPEAPEPQEEALPSAATSARKGMLRPTITIGLVTIALVAAAVYAGALLSGGNVSMDLFRGGGERKRHRDAPIPFRGAQTREAIGHMTRYALP